MLAFLYCEEFEKNLNIRLGEKQNAYIQLETQINSVCFCPWKHNHVMM